MQPTAFKSAAASQSAQRWGLSTAGFGDACGHSAQAVTSAQTWRTKRSTPRSGLAAAEQTISDAQVVADAVRRAGGEAIVADPDSLPPRIADRYLELKAAGRL